MNKSLEIAISTFNRADILEAWIKRNIHYILALKIELSIYDSSTDGRTQKLIETYNTNSPLKIRYCMIDSSLRLDEKVMLSILNSKCDYVWPLGDSRVFDFSIVEEKVFPFLENGCDLSCIWSKTGKRNDGKIYFDSDSFFRDCFWHVTWLGGLIFRSDLFDFTFGDPVYVRYFSKYNRNDGFSYLGVLFDILSQKEQLRVSMSEIGAIKEISSHKVPGWVNRYLDVWCDNLCFVIDNMEGISKESKDLALKEVWDILRLDGFEWCYTARTCGGLNKEIYEFYDSHGMLDRVSRHKARIQFVATTDIRILRFFYLFILIKNKAKIWIKRFLKGAQQ